MCTHQEIANVFSELKEINVQNVHRYCQCWQDTYELNFHIFAEKYPNLAVFDEEKYFVEDHFHFQFRQRKLRSSCYLN